MIRVLGLLIAVVASLPVQIEAAGGAPIEPLTQAHAHNDYHHQRPLFDALDLGICNVEADIFLKGGALLVGHERAELEPARTLEALYLQPLLHLVRKNGGHVIAEDVPFTLLIDIKSNGRTTYRALDAVLARFGEMLTSVVDGEVRKGAVTVIISGNRAWDAIAEDPTRFAGIDGRLSDLKSDSPAHLVPLISDKWSNAFNWTGRGPMPDNERALLRRMVDDAHQRGRRIRFWGTTDRPSPERIALWTELMESGVDLIGTDDLAGLADFLLDE